MGERYWLWVIVRLAVGIAIVGWAASYLGSGSAEKEFQKTLDAMKQVHSFRVASTANQAGVQHNEMLWEVDCDRDIVHYQMHMVNTSVDPPAELNQDELHVGTLEFDHQKDGSWSKGKYSYRGDPAKRYCGSLAHGNDTDVLPRIATMIQRGILQKGDKKTVNGVRCREWLVALKGAPSGLEHDTVCLGLQDHLPYELTIDWEHARFSYSDYNSPLQFDAPEGALESASSTSGSN